MAEAMKRLSLAELRATSEFQRLTQKQQLFVATYCEQGLVDGKYDPIAATRTAYECKNLESARVMSYSLMQNIRIVSVLNLHFNVTPTEDYIRMLERAVRNKNLTNAQLGAMRLLAEVKGIKTAIPFNHSLSSVAEDLAAEKREQAKDKKRKAKQDPDTKPPKKADYAI